MSYWYWKYSRVFEKPFIDIDKNLIDKVNAKVCSIQSETPLVSIVIIAHNEASRLLSCIWSLANNKYNFPVEIIGVDNCSTDDTKKVYVSLGVKYFYESKPGPGYARQCGLNNAKGKYYVCIDGDSMYPPEYIKTMVEELKKNSVVAVFSLWSFLPDKKNTRLKLWFYELLRDIHLRIQAIKRPELAVRGMAFAFDTELARKINFRTDIRRGEDGSLLLELKKYGQVKFVLKNKARIMTSCGTLNADGSLTNSLVKRVGKTFKNIAKYFTKETKYTDEDSNIL